MVPLEEEEVVVDGWVVVAVAGMEVFVDLAEDSSLLRFRSSAICCLI